MRRAKGCDLNKLSSRERKREGQNRVMKGERLNKD
jgi:hypothetical protein